MENILDRKKRLIKERNIISLLLFPCWILSIFISSNSMINVLPMLEILTMYLKIDEIDRDMFLSLVEIYIRYFPMFIYIAGKVCLFNINKEIRLINSACDIELERIGVEKKMIDNVLNDCKDTEIIDDIVKRFNQLPRGKQMEILNYIKGDLELYDKELASKIDLISDENRESLLTECTDILFPSLDDEVGYSRKRKK